MLFLLSIVVRKSNYIDPTAYIHRCLRMWPILLTAIISEHRKARVSLNWYWLVFRLSHHAGVWPTTVVHHCWLNNALFLIYLLYLQFAKLHCGFLSLRLKKLVIIYLWVFQQSLLACKLVSTGGEIFIIVCAQFIFMNRVLYEACSERG